MSTTPGIGHNSGNTENVLEGALRVVKARYNAAMQDKRNAAAVIRDLKADFKLANAEQFEALNKAKQDAKDALHEALKQHPGFIEAEALKAEAAAAMKEAIKLAKEKGLDLGALRQVLRMDEMDVIEREEYFDRIDQYAKALRLWQSFQ